MTAIQPTSEQIAKLTVRSIVAYASRAAQRVVAAQNVVHLECVEDVLRLVNHVVQESTIVKGWERCAANALVRIADETLLTGSLTMARVGLSVRAATMCCLYAIGTVCRDECQRPRSFERLVNGAARAARQLDDRAEEKRLVTDYELLVRLYGEHESITLGDPFDPSGSGPLGPLSKAG